MFDLHIVTPCIRVENLERIAESIVAPVDWLVVLDSRFGLDIERARRAVAGVPRARVEMGRSEGPGEYAQCNAALEMISDGWIVFLDDDNLLHPALPSRLAEIVRDHPGAGAVLFDQDLGGGIRRAAPKNVRVGRVDSGQFAVSRSFVGTDRFSVYAPSADGAFIESLYRRAPSRFVFVSEVLATYNTLTPGRFGEGSLRRLTLGPRPDVASAGSLYFHRSAGSSESIKISSRGDRLYMTGTSVLRSPLPAGPLRLTGQAWLDAETIAGGRLVIDGVDRPLNAPPLLRFLPRNVRRVVSRVLRKPVSITADVTGGEIEIAFTAPPGATLVLDGLRIVQNE